MNMRNFLSQLKTGIKYFFEQLKNDWSKMTWPSFKGSLALFVVAIIACIIFAFIFLQIDLWLAKLMNFILLK